MKLKSMLLGEICQITNGNSIPIKIKEEKFTGISGMPYIATKDISFEGDVNYDNGISISDDELKKFKIASKESILICAEGGSAGRKMAFIDRNCCFVNKLFSIKTSSKILPKFVFYYLKSKSFQSQFKKSLTGLIGGVSLSKIKNFKIVFPELIEDQGKIIAKFDNVFSEIKNSFASSLKKEKQLEKLKSSILFSTFNKYSFDTKKLGELFKTASGGTPLKSKKEFYDEGKINWLLSGAVCERHIERVNTFITEEGLLNSSAKLFPINTLLVAMYGATAGQVGILHIESSTNQAVCGIYPNKDYKPEFLYYYFLYYKKTLLQEVSGVAQPNLSQVKIRNIPIPLLSLNKQDQIITKLDSAFGEIQKAKNSINKIKKNLQSLKSVILDKDLHLNK